MVTVAVQRSDGDRVLDAFDGVRTVEDVQHGQLCRNAGAVVETQPVSNVLGIKLVVLTRSQVAEAGDGQV
ncbi:hypothetical protein D3C87_1964780 [compost metagenome]